LVSDWRDGYRAAVSEFLMKEGMFVEDTNYPKDDWHGEPDPEDYSDYNTTYGWADYTHNIGRSYAIPPEPACRAVSVDPSTMRERSLSMFTDTFHSNEHKVGVEVRATCACGKYTNKWLRWEGTVGDILPALLRQ
jgi:hypothetical protein